MSSSIEDSRAVNSEERGWTTQTLKLYYDALRTGDERFMVERDRRYTEVNIEREKALKIKEEADKAALGLAREIQTYKDEKANQLREQITGERGLYATKDDLIAAIREVAATIRPLSDFISGQVGRASQQSDRRTQTNFTTTHAIALIGIVAAVVMGLMFR